MADKINNLEKVKEKSLDAPPSLISRTTLIVTAVTVLLIVVSIYMIAKFSSSIPTETQRNANVAEENVGP